MDACDRWHTFPTHFIFTPPLHTFPTHFISYISPTHFSNTFYFLHLLYTLFQHIFISYTSPTHFSNTFYFLKLPYTLFQHILLLPPPLHTFQHILFLTPPLHTFPTHKIVKERCKDKMCWKSVLSVTCVHLSRPSIMFRSVCHVHPPHVRHVCPSCLSITSVHHVSQSLLSIMSVRHICPSCLFIMSVHHICL